MATTAGECTLTARRCALQRPVVRLAGQGVGAPKSGVSASGLPACACAVQS